MDARRSHLHLVPGWVDLRGGVLVDIGANEGDWTAGVLRAVPGVRIIAAEPGDEPRAVLSTRFGADPNVTIDPRAVTDAPGVATYHRTRASVFASLLPPEHALHELYALPGFPTEVLETVEVPTVTLDELVGDQHVPVLKLDVQGGELAVLRGGHRVLERTDAVLVEVLFVGHYEGDATFGPLDTELRRLGFALMDMSRPFRLEDGPALWADACWSRAAALTHLLAWKEEAEALGLA